MRAAESMVDSANMRHPSPSSASTTSFLAGCRMRFVRDGYNSTLRKRRAFPTTESELRLIAALAIIGFSINPNHG